MTISEITEQLKHHSELIEELAQLKENAEPDRQYGINQVIQINLKNAKECVSKLEAMLNDNI